MISLLALDVTENNVIGLYGCNHTRTILGNGRTTARKILDEQGVPVASVRMEFNGIEKEKNRKYTFLDQRMTIQGNERPTIIRLEDLPFAANQRLRGYRDFHRKNQRFQTGVKDNPKTSEQHPYEAVVLFPIKATNLKQKS